MFYFLGFRQLLLNNNNDNIPPPSLLTHALPQSIQSDWRPHRGRVNSWLHKPATVPNFKLPGALCALSCLLFIPIPITWVYGQPDHEAIWVPRANLLCLQQNIATLTQQTNVADRQTDR